MSFQEYLKENKYINNIKEAKEIKSLKDLMGALPSNSENAEVGKMAIGIWFDDPNYYYGKIEKSDNGTLGIQLPNDTWGDIEGAYWIYIF